MTHLCSLAADPSFRILVPDSYLKDPAGYFLDGVDAAAPKSLVIDEDVLRESVLGVQPAAEKRDGRVVYTTVATPSDSELQRFQRSSQVLTQAPVSWLQSSGCGSS